MTSSLPDCVKQAGTLVRGTKKAPEEWSFFYFIMITGVTTFEWTKKLRDLSINFKS